MIRSLVCKLNGSDTKINSAIIEAQRFANMEGYVYEKKGQLCLTLLSEELLCMVNGVLNVKNGEFWIEKERWNYKICLVAEAYSLGDTAKQRLLDASFDGKNSLYRGFKGKLHMILDFISIENDPSADIPKEIEMGLRSNAEDTVWSLEKAREHIDPEKKAEFWDELESSVLNALADDIEVGIRGHDAFITVYKSFPPVFRM